jgi:hypothetical protein
MLEFFMVRKISTPTPELNRLRAALALIPIIESGLNQKTISIEKASLMASFCEWAYAQNAMQPEAEALARDIGTGLKRLESALSSVG